MPKWKALLSSRKFWAALMGLIVMVIKAWKPDFPLDGKLWLEFSQCWWRISSVPLWKTA